MKLATMDDTTLEEWFERKSPSKWMRADGRSARESTMDGNATALPLGISIQALVDTVTESAVECCQRSTPPHLERERTHLANKARRNGRPVCRPKTRPGFLVRAMAHQLTLAADVSRYPFRRVDQPSGQWPVRGRSGRPRRWGQHDGAIAVLPAQPIRVKP